MTINNIQKFLIRFYNNEFPHQRVGQAFINYYTTGVTDPDLFYCEDKNKAVQIIIDKYLDKQT
jgi:hypothetical protein